MKAPRLFFIFFIMIVCLSTQSWALPNDQNVSEQRFTLSDLLKTKAIVLQGRNASYNLYLPTVPQWHIQGIKLQLHIQYSPILRPSSSFTVVVNDVPLNTIKLDGQNNHYTTMSVDIPAGLINKKNKTITINLLGYLKMSTESCEYVKNKGNWLIVTGNSTAHYSYKYATNKVKLKNFPLPFINENAPFKDKITLLMPQDLNLDTFSPFLELSNILAKKASWRGVDFITQSFNGFENIDPQDNTIIIGTPKELGISSLDNTQPYTLKNGQWLNENQRPLAAEEGIILLQKSGQKGDAALLLISANSKKGIQTALDSLEDNVLYYKADYPNIFLAKPLESQIPLNQLDAVRSLKDLGYQDGIVYGDGKQTLSYQLNVSEEYIGSALEAVVRFSHSPFLDLEVLSSLTVSINDVPINGVNLKPGNSEKETFSLTIPADLVQLGKNKIEMSFDLPLKEENCSQYSLDRLWGIIYDSSYFRLTKGTQSSIAQIKAYPYLFTSKTIFALPDTKDFYQSATLLQKTIELAATLSEVSSVEVMANTKLQLAKQDANLIYLGSGTQPNKFVDIMQVEFKKLIQHLAMSSNKNFQYITPDFFKNAFKKEQNIGFVQIQNTLNQHVNLMLYGYSPRDLELALSLLNDNYRRTTLSGNLAIAFNNDTYTALSSKEIIREVKKEVRFYEVAQKTKMGVIIAFGSIILLIILWAWLRRRRQKRQLL